MTNFIVNIAEGAYDDVKAALVSVGHSLQPVEAQVVAGIDNLESLFTADVWPQVKTFIETLASQVGQAALKSAVTAVPLLVSGGFGAAAATIGAAVIATATVDAPIDATAALQATQAALQVVKVASSTVTAGDAPTVAAIAAATSTPEITNVSGK